MYMTDHQGDWDLSFFIVIIALNKLCVLDHAQIGINYASRVAAICFAIAKCNVFAVSQLVFAVPAALNCVFICIQLAENRMNRNWLFQEAMRGQPQWFTWGLASLNRSTRHPYVHPTSHPSIRGADIATHHPSPIIISSCSRILSWEEGLRSKQIIPSRNSHGNNNSAGDSGNKSNAWSQPLHAHTWSQQHMTWSTFVSRSYDESLPRFHLPFGSLQSPTHEPRTYLQVRPW